MEEGPNHKYVLCMPWACVRVSETKVASYSATTIGPSRSDSRQALASALGSCPTQAQVMA